MNNGKGNKAFVPGDFELDPMSKMGQMFEEFCDLIKKPRIDFDGEASFNDHLKRVKSVLSGNVETIFKSDIAGRNVFHILAQNPDRNLDLLRIFTPFIDGSHAAESEYTSKHHLEKLLSAQYGKSSKSTPVHIAVNHGFAEFLRAIFNTYPHLVNSQDGAKDTPLHLATKTSMPEALECMKIIVDIVERNDLIELIKARNVRDQTPVHTLCTKVPANESARVIEKLSLLLRFPCTHDIMTLTDDTRKTPLHLLCSQDDQYRDLDNNPNVQELLRQLLTSRNVGVNHQTRDSHSLTALHLLTISECPKLIAILLETGKGVDLTVKDAHGRMAIHYATEKAIRQKSHEVIRKLADWPTFAEKIKNSKSSLEPQDAYRNYIMWDTFNDIDDGSLNTAMTSACKAQSAKTVQYFLENVYDAKRNFGIWFEGKGSADQIFGLKHVYKRTPAALEFLFDKSIQVDMKESNEIRVQLHTDISALTALDRPIKDEQSTTAETEYLSYANHWSEDTQAKLLLHPLSQCALHAIWKKMLPYRIIWTILSAIWLVAYLCLVPLEYSEEEKAYPPHQTVAAGVLMILTTISSCYYIFEGIVTLYLKEFCGLPRSRILNWCQMILTGLVAGTVLLAKEPTAVHFNSAAAGISLSYFLFWLKMGIIGVRVGMEREYHWQTLKKILRAIFCVLPIVFGFLRAFQQLLPDYFSGGFSWAFVKMFVMMTGEQDFKEMYEEYNKQTASKNATGEDGSSAVIVDQGDSSYFFFSWMPYLFFLFFLFLVSISFYNMVTAVAVDEIQNMRRKLEIHQIMTQLRLVNYVQRTMVSLLNPIIKCIPCCEKILPSYISYRNTGADVILSQKITWYIDYDDKNRTGFRSIVDEVKRMLTTKGSSPEILCGNRLPKYIKLMVFEMYQKQL